MAAKKNTIETIAGLVLIVAAAGLIYWGYDTSNQTANRLIGAVSGSTSNEVIMAYTGGVACILVGLFLLFRK